MCKGLDLTDENEELSSENRNRTAAQIVTAAGDKANVVELAPGDVIVLTDLLVRAQEEHRKDIMEAKTPAEKRAIAEVGCTIMHLSYSKVFHFINIFKMIMLL